MSIFSLNWFKSRKEQEIEDLKHEIKMKELQRQLERMENPPAPVQPSYNTTWTSVGVGGFRVPNGSIALVLKIEMNPAHNDIDDYHAHILVDGKLGWIYPEDGEAINETR
jgi:hypothetical protein